MPTWLAARPTPGAAYIVSVMSAARRRSLSSNDSTGFVGSRRTGSPSVRIGNTVTVGPLLQMRLGLDPGDDTTLREPAHRVAERRKRRRVERDQAYRRVPGRRHQQGAMRQRLELAVERGGSGDAEDRRADGEPRLGPADPLGPMEPVPLAGDQCLNGRVVRVHG